MMLLMLRKHPHFVQHCLKCLLTLSQNPHLQRKQGWHKDAQSWANHWGIKKDIILQNKDNIKKIIISKFKENLWDDKELERRRKIRYYMEVINFNLKNQNYLFVLTNLRRK